MSNFHSKWRIFLNEDASPHLLLEARVKDIKAKYKVLDKSGWIRWARLQIEGVFGPKGVSKYLMYWAREMHRQYEDLDVEEMQSNADVQEVGEVVLDLIVKFQQNQQRIEEKDIYKYNIAELQQTMEGLGLSQSKKRKKEKEEAVEGSEIVYDDDDIFAVRPYTADASCYYGKNTRWCISATQARNYFDQYTQEGKGFVMLRLDNLSEDDDYKKIALVFDSDGDFDEAYDATDEAVGWKEVRDALGRNYDAPNTHDNDGRPFNVLDEETQEKIEELTQTIMSAGSDNIMTNPPDPTADYEARLDEIEEEYRDKIEHAHFGYDIDEYVYFHGGFNIEFDEELFEGGEYSLPSGWSEESAMTREIESHLASTVHVYPEEIEISSHGGNVTFELRMNSGDYDPNPDGYDLFLDSLHDDDQKYPAMKRVIEKYLMEEGYIAKGAFENLSDQMMEIGRELRNFTWDEDKDAGDEFIKFESEPFEVSDVPQTVLRRISDIEKVKRGMPPTWQSPSLTKSVVVKLGDLHQKITSFLEKQLELPISDLPPRVVKELTIPEFLRIELIADPVAVQLEPVKSRIIMNIDDVSLSEEIVEATIEVVKFVDQNFSEVRNAVIDSVRSFRQKIREEEKARLDSLQDSTRRLLSIAQVLQSKSNNRTTRHYLDFIDDWKLGSASDEAMLEAVRNLYNHLKELGEIPEDLPPPQSSSLQESFNLQDEINKYLNEEKGRTRHRGIYKFYCMLGYSIDVGQQKQRGLDDILADVRALPNVTIVTIVIANRRIAEHRYIAGVSIKFIPSIPGKMNSPEDTKIRILRDIKRLNNLERIFKISTSVERIE